MLNQYWVITEDFSFGKRRKSKLDGEEAWRMKKAEKKLRNIGYGWKNRRCSKQESVNGISFSFTRFYLSEFLFGAALILFSDTAGCKEQERKKWCLQARCISALLNKSGVGANKILLKILQSKKFKL